MIYIMTTHEQNIKNRYADDGAIGHNFLAWLVAPVLAQRYGIRYIYTNIVPDYMGTKWNQFLAFDKIVPSERDNNGVRHWFLKDIKNYKIVDLPKTPFPAKINQFESIIKKYQYSSISEDDNIILRTAQGQSIEVSWLYWLNNDLREKYDASHLENPIVVDCDPNIVNVVVHWRRGDISQANQPERWVTNNEYIYLLKNICLALEEKYLQNKLKIHICSEGDLGDFFDLYKNPLLNGTLIFHLNESPYTTFHRMVIADVLINAKSAFSVCAAYLNKNIKLIIPFSIYLNDSFPKNDNFKDLISLDNNMNFDIEKLRREINARRNYNNF